MKTLVILFPKISKPVTDNRFINFAQIDIYP